MKIFLSKPKQVCKCFIWVTNLGKIHGEALFNFFLLRQPIKVEAFIQWWSEVRSNNTTPTKKFMQTSWFQPNFGDYLRIRLSTLFGCELLQNSLQSDHHYGVLLHVCDSEIDRREPTLACGGHPWLVAYHHANKFYSFACNHWRDKVGTD